MGFLYQIDKPMRVNDYHKRVIDGANTQASFLGVIPDGPPISELKGTWAVKPAPRLKNPAGDEGRDKTDGFGKTIPLTLEGIVELFISEGWGVTDVAKLLKAGSEATSSPAEQQAFDAINFALSIQRAILSAQECRVASGGKVALTRGVFSWLSPDEHKVAGVQEVDASLRPSAAQYYSGKFDDFNEASFKAMLNAAYFKRRAPVSLVGYVGIDLKTKMSMWNELVPVTNDIALARQVNKPANVLELVVDTFKYDAGTVRTISQLDLLCDANSADLVETYQTPKAGAFLDIGMWEMQWLQSITHIPGVDNGGGERGHHRAKGRLNCLNPSWQCAVVPATPAA